MNLFFDDLELPHLARTLVGDIKELKPQRAGYTTQGSPVNLSTVRTMRQALGRRIAMRGPHQRKLRELEAQHADIDDDEIDEHAKAEMTLLRQKLDKVPFLDELDLRFRNRVMVPKPMSQAVMFCLMDVSASMDEHRKDLAKRFFTLLHLFLARKYERVDIVFIRHTDDAEEVDEQTFFGDRKTGGTIVLSALALMKDIIDARYPRDQWNIYGAQASDGDAFGVDPERSRAFLEEQVLPLTRYFSYIEGNEGTLLRSSALATSYGRIENPHFAMATVYEHRDIYPVFRQLFSADKSQVNTI